MPSEIRDWQVIYLFSDPNIHVANPRIPEGAWTWILVRWSDDQFPQGHTPVIRQEGFRVTPTEQFHDIFCTQNFPELREKKVSSN